MISKKDNRENILQNIINYTNLSPNKTRHASHLNSAPWWVFDLYGDS